MGTPSLRTLIDLIAASDEAAALRLVDAEPALATETLCGGATRAEPAAHFIAGLQCYAYEGDTALHFAAAAYSVELVRRLLAAGAAVTAANRRGATALHYAATGDPASSRWDPPAQAATLAALVAAGADPNARDRNGTTPLHRAVRTRSAAAVRQLLESGADPALRTRNGSTPARLAAVTSGRSGGGSAEARSEQAMIVRLLAG